MRSRLMHGGAHFEATAAVVEPRIPMPDYSRETRILSVSNRAERHGAPCCASRIGDCEATFLLCRTSAIDGVGRRNAPGLPITAASSQATFLRGSSDKSTAEPADRNARSRHGPCSDDPWTFCQFCDPAERSAALNTPTNRTLPAPSAVSASTCGLLAPGLPLDRGPFEPRLLERRWKSKTGLTHYPEWAEGSTYETRASNRFLAADGPDGRGRLSRPVTCCPHAKREPWP